MPDDPCPNPTTITNASCSAPSDIRPRSCEVEAAIRTLLRFAGDDPEREGLVETPSRVMRAYRELFAGYDIDPLAFLERTFSEIDSYDEMVVLRDVAIVSHCEHHMVPFIGIVHVGYLPHHRVVGISKLARVIDAFARRLQIQERLTVQIAEAINTVLKPRGVAVVVRAQHQCMAMRGVKKPGVSMVTSRMAGEFHENPETRREFLAIIGEG